MTRGRLPDSNKVRGLKGDPNKDRYLPDSVQTDSLIEVPETPGWWTDETKQIFREKCELLIKYDMLKDLDVSFVKQLSLIEAKLDELWKKGEVPPGYLGTQFKGYCAHAGLSFIERQKIKGGHAAKETTNKYAK